MPPRVSCAVQRLSRSSSGASETRPGPAGGRVRSGWIDENHRGERNSVKVVGEIASGTEHKKRNQMSQWTCLNKQRMNVRKKTVPQEDFSGIIVVLYRQVLTCICASLCLALFHQHLFTALPCKTRDLPINQNAIYHIRAATETSRFS
jgi:hypothetical protein